MKKCFAIFLSFLLIFQCFSTVTYAEGTYKVVDRDIHMMSGSTIADVIDINGTTTIAIDSLSFYIGASATEENGKPGMRKNGHTFLVEPGTNKAYVDGIAVTMPVSSFQYKGETFVPLSFAVKSLGLMVYWRQQNQTIYIQSPENYEKALDIVKKSLATVQSKKSVTTTYENYTNISSDHPDRYFIKSTGIMQTDMKNNVAKDQYTSILYNGYYDSLSHKPVQTYVSTDALDTLKVLKYITSNGIYSLNSKGTYDKAPVPKENISTLDMATKSVQTDLNLFLYSASISTDYDGSFKKENEITVLEAETDIGTLLKLGFDIYMPGDSKSLHWNETYQTIQYDPQTLLPKNMTLHLSAYYQDKTINSRINMDYNQEYLFDFNKDVQIKLPNGVQ